MIKISKNPEPQVLIDNKAQWTTELLQKIAEKGGFSKLTSAEKGHYVDRYNQAEVKSALQDSDGVTVCAYCEHTISTGYLTIEHYHPKALYPRLTFEWDNMIPACIVCNDPKSNYDTQNEPFINPILEDPEEYLTYENLRIKPRYQSGDNWLKAKRVIEKCCLERIELIDDLTEKAKNFYSLEQSLKAYIEKYNAYNQNARKQKMAQSLMLALDSLKGLAKPGKANAGYVRHLIRQSSIIKDCMGILQTHAVLLSLPATGYDWGWNYHIPTTYPY